MGGESDDYYLIADQAMAYYRGDLIYFRGKLMGTLAELHCCIVVGNALRSLTKKEGEL